MGARAGSRGRRQAPVDGIEDEDRRRSEHVCAGALLPRESQADDPPHAPRPRRRHTARTAGTLAGVPIRLSTKHGFNEFREGGASSRSAIRTIGALAQPGEIAISRGLAPLAFSETEGFPEPDFEIVHYGIAAGPEPKPYAGETPHFLCIGRLIPIKGHGRAAGCAVPAGGSTSGPMRLSTSRACAGWPRARARRIFFAPSLAEMVASSFPRSASDARSAGGRGFGWRAAVPSPRRGGSGMAAARGDGARRGSVIAAAIGGASRTSVRDGERRDCS